LVLIFVYLYRSTVRIIFFQNLYDMKKETTFFGKSKNSPTKLGRIFIQILLSVSAVIFIAGCGKEDIAKSTDHVSYQTVQVHHNGPMREVCDFKTFTQGGWGAVPSGSNPGVYLHANFASAFPNGLTIGSASGYKLTLTSAQAVTDLLPCGGQAAGLTTNYTDPVTLKNVLAGQLVALTLSVGFDYYDPNFAGSSYNLGELPVVSGTFQGMTINEVLAIANNAFGGGASNYTMASLVYILTALNENFDNGTTNNGVVNCSYDTGSDYSK
jgi:hypothetical protein